MYMYNVLLYKICDINTDLELKLSFGSDSTQAFGTQWAILGLSRDFGAQLRYLLYAAVSVFLCSFVQFKEYVMLVYSMLVTTHIL